MTKNYIDNGDGYYSHKDSILHRNSMTVVDLKKELEAFSNLKKEHEKHVGHKDHENHVKNLDARIAEINSLIKNKEAKHG